MSIATFDDVQDRFHRELAEEDRRLVETRLSDAEGKIRAKIPDLEYRLSTEPGLEDIVKRICADAVLRLIRNPEGYVQETDGAYTYMLSQTLAEGKLIIEKDEWADLGIRTKVVTIHMNPARARQL